MQKTILIIIIFVIILGVAIMKSPNNEEKYLIDDISIATFSGGCFWCSESTFQEQEGVFEVISGYVGGNETNPTYEEVSSGKTTHREGVQVYYDKTKITYQELLEIYWQHIDPTQKNGQFGDIGNQYKTAIYYSNENEKKLAEESKKKLNESKIYDLPVVTQIIPFTTFYPAEEYHQDYYLKQSGHYELYSIGSGRKKFIEENQEKIKMALENKNNKIENLTDYQVYITQHGGTEKPFENEYWDNHEEGIYVDVVTGVPLFSSIDKYDSGSGWPSFTKPIDTTSIIEKEDNSLGMQRTEVKSEDGDTHLGHVFDDGPQESGGQRYCINSASLKFISKDNLEKEGYGQYLSLFK